MIENLPLAQAWFRKAENDIAAVEALRNSENLFEAAAFHAQQAAEKYLKGYLAFLGVTNIPKTHNLVSLSKLCREYGDSLELKTDSLSELTVYAVDARYDLAFTPDIDLIISALQAVEQVKKAVLLSVDKLKKAEEDKT